MSDVKGNVICIVGMHRSGTSMIARLLHRCGLYLGAEDQILGPRSGNEDGHFEHTGFLEINDALMQHFGGSWYFPPKFEPGWERDGKLEQTRVEARSLVDTFSGKSPWGWKEPRTTILLSFWKSIVPNVRFVICVRSPLEVAESLAKRDRIPVERGVFLWHRYTRAAIEGTEDCPRMLIFYDDFFTDTAAEFVRLIDFCGLPRPSDLSILETEIRGELRHHRSEVAELLGSASVPAEHKIMYLGLRALSGREPASPAPKNNSAENAGTFLRVLDEFHNHARLAQLQSELTEKDHELFKLRTEILNDLRTNHRWAYRMYRNFIKPFRLRQP
ncbi:MAG: Sulfotransferase family [Deltaproteobacteria bacterium]|nr:Sulfotransferase family [Deltaproteobacteria bacterium]